MGEMYRLPESAVPDESENVSRETESANVSRETDTAPLVCAHPGCQNGIVKPARGRTPKYCPDHKSTSSRANGDNSTGKSKWNRGAEIERILTDYVKGLGEGMQLFPPVAMDGVIVANNMPRVIHELVVLADDDKRLRKYLEYLASPGRYAPLAMACFSVIVPILANHGITPLGLLGGFVNSESEGR